MKKKPHGQVPYSQKDNKVKVRVKAEMATLVSLRVAKKMKRWHLS